MLTQEQILRRYPRLVTHMIAESLGYFTPRAAANAIIAHKLQQPFACEMYVHFAQSFDSDALREVNQDFIQRAFQRRHHHYGPMSSYSRAREVVRAEQKGSGPIFAS